MAGSESSSRKRSWPIVYGPRPTTEPEPSPRLAWALFLLVGLPFILMTVLTVLGRAGIYVDLFRPLYVSWPPDVLKPFLGLAVFAATLAYLMYRVGHRAGFQLGTGVGLAAARSYAEAHPLVVVTPAPAEGEMVPVPPPPPPPEPGEGEPDDAPEDL